MNWFFVLFITFSSASTDNRELSYLPPPGFDVGVTLEDKNIPLPKEVYATTLSPDNFAVTKSEKYTSEFRTDGVQNIKTEFKQNKNNDALQSITIDSFEQATNNFFHEEYETTTDFFINFNSNTLSSVKQTKNHIKEPSQRNYFQSTFSSDMAESTGYTQENNFDRATEINSQTLPFRIESSDNDVFVNNDHSVSNHPAVYQEFDQNRGTERPKSNLIQMAKQLKHKSQLPSGNAKKPYEDTIYKIQSTNKIAVYKNESVQANTDKVRIISANKNRPHIRGNTDNIAVITDYHNIRTSEKYSYSFDTSNGIHTEQHGVGGVKAVGSYSYTGDDGKLYNVTYIADENGFQPTGDHLPTAPPIPETILKVIEQSKRDEELGIYDNGSYNDQKYGYKNYESVGHINKTKLQAKEGELTLEDIDHSVDGKTLSNVVTKKTFEPTIIKKANSNFRKSNTKSRKEDLVPDLSSKDYDKNGGYNNQLTTLKYKLKTNNNIQQKHIVSDFNNKLNKKIFPENKANDSLSLHKDFRNGNIKDAIQKSHNYTNMLSLQDIISAQFKNINLKKKAKGDLNVENNFTYQFTSSTTPNYPFNSSIISSYSERNLPSNQKRLQSQFNKQLHPNIKKDTNMFDNLYGMKNTVPQSINSTRTFPSFVVSSETLGIVTRQNLHTNIVFKPTNLKNKPVKLHGTFAINNNKGRFTIKSDQSQLLPNRTHILANIVSRKTTERPVDSNQRPYYSVRGKIQPTDEINEDTISENLETAPTVSSDPFNKLADSSSLAYFTTIFHPVSSTFHAPYHYSGKDADINAEFESGRDKLKVQKNIKLEQYNKRRKINLPDNKAIRKDFSGPKQHQGFNAGGGYYYK